MQVELNRIKEVSSDYEKRISLIEKQSRERNIIFFGINEGEKSYGELEWNILKTLEDELNIKCNQMELQIVRRMGKYEEKKMRPIVVTFSTYGRKITILKNKKHIKSSTIYIKEDFPPKVLDTRKILQDQLQKEKEAGNIAYIRYDKLIVREPPKKHSQQEEEKMDSRNKKRLLEITPPHCNENSQRELVRQQALKKIK